MKDVRSSKRLGSRIGARLLDYAFFYYAANFIFTFFCLNIPEKYALIFLFFLPLFWAPIEALLLKFWGTTLGKALFGISLRQENGSKLTFKQALLRSLSEGWKNLFPLNIGNLVYFLQKKGRFPLDQKLQIDVKTSKKRGLRYWIGALMLSFSCLTFFFEEELVQCTSKQSSLFVSHSVNQEWTLFKGPNDRFQISFPKEPKDQQKQFPVPGKAPLEYKEHYTMTDDQVTYSVGYATLPKSWLKWSSGLLLKGSAKVIASHLPQTQLLKKRSVSFKNYPGLDFVMQQKGKQIRGRLVLVGSTLYKVEVSYPKEMGASLDDQIAQFVESFDPAGA